jgi:hypothetical protein
VRTGASVGPVTAAGIPPEWAAPTTADVRRAPRRGTSSACATKRMHPRPAREIVVSTPGTRPSLGPSTRAHQSSLRFRRKTPEGGALRSASRSGKPAQAGGTGTGASEADAARLAVHHRSREGAAWCIRKGRRSRPPSLRGSRALVRCPHVVTQLQKSVGDVRSRISSAYAPQKGRQGRVNGGLVRGASRRVTPPACASIETTIRESASPGEITGGDRRRPRVTRDRHPAASSSPQAVRRSWGRGCNGHRILRRAPTDRRHSGSSRDVGFHGTASTMVLAVFAPSDPCPSFQKKTARPSGSSREGG